MPVSYLLHGAPQLPTYTYLAGRSLCLFHGACSTPDCLPFAALILLTSCHRYMFFLARCRHAPQFCGRLFRRTRMDGTDSRSLHDDTTMPHLERLAFGSMETTPSSTTTRSEGPENGMAGYELEEVPTSANLSVPPDPRRSRVRTGNSTPPSSARPRIASHGSQMTVESSDTSMSSVEDDSLDMDTVIPPRPNRITRQINYDKSKTVPWVVCV